MLFSKKQSTIHHAFLQKQSDPLCFSPKKQSNPSIMLFAKKLVRLQSGSSYLSPNDSVAVLRSTPHYISISCVSRHVVGPNPSSPPPTRCVSPYPSISRIFWPRKSARCPPPSPPFHGIIKVYKKRRLQKTFV